MATRKKKGTPQKDVRRKKTKEEAVKRPLTKLERQLRVLDPSIPMALYLTLLNHEEVAYLREDDQSIHGFLVDLSVDQELSGFLFLSIQQQLLYAYLSLDSDVLILFPSVAAAKDFRYGFKELKGSDVLIKSEDFESYEVFARGTLHELLDPYVPPHSKKSLSAVEVANEFTQLGTLTDDASKDVSKHSPDVDSSGSVIEPSDKTMTKVETPDIDVEGDIPLDMVDVDMGMDDYYDDYEGSGYSEGLSVEDLAVSDSLPDDEAMAVSSVVDTFAKTEPKKRYLLDVFEEQRFASRAEIQSYMIRTLLIRAEAATAVISNLTKMAMASGLSDEKVIANFVKMSLCNLLKEQGDVIGFVNREVYD